MKTNQAEHDLVVVIFILLMMALVIAGGMIAVSLRNSIIGWTRTLRMVWQKMGSSRN